MRSKAVEQVTIAADYNNMALTFNNDGTKMYTSSTKAVTPASTAKGDKVYEYVLTTAYNISTATLRTSLDVGEYTGSSTHIHGAMQVVFNNDGTKMFIGDHNRNIIEWTLTTPYDIDTASSTYPIGSSYDTNLQEKRVLSVAFNNDGTKMFVAGNGKNNSNVGEINEYALDTPFVITSGVTHINTEDLSSDHSYIAVSYTHLTLPTNLSV